MICPHCKHDISDEEIAKHLAAKGGRAGRKRDKRTAGRLGGLERAKRIAEARKIKRKEK